IRDKRDELFAASFAGQLEGRLRRESRRRRLEGAFLVGVFHLGVEVDLLGGQDLALALGAGRQLEANVAIRGGLGLGRVEIDGFGTFANELDIAVAGFVGDELGAAVALLLFFG